MKEAKCMVSCVGYTSGDTWIGLWNHNLEYCYDGAGSPCDGVFSTMDPSRPFPDSMYDYWWQYDANGRWAGEKLNLFDQLKDIKHYQIF